MRAAVISDSEQLTEQCVARQLPNVLRSPGLPIHPIASNASMLSSQINLDKVFVDWWLLACSTGILTFGNPMSSFLHTANLFRSAGSDGNTGPARASQLVSVPGNLGCSSRWGQGLQHNRSRTLPTAPMAKPMAEPEAEGGGTPWWLDIKDESQPLTANDVLRMCDVRTAQCMK
mmetsp:Transcript_51362/g.102232  ORF Transcript_51362/g.102232 Transcript_51362/m.102232 type:complete len:174 (-) Transcript_51362:83-604(-)